MAESRESELSPFEGTILETLSPEEAAPSWECRVWERFPCDLATTCQPLSALTSEGPQWTARARDISAGGVGLILRRRFEPGTGLALVLAGADAAVYARVVHVTALAGIGWMHGCQFVNPLTPEELNHLLLPADTPAATLEQPGRTTDYLHARATSKDSSPGLRRLGAAPVPVARSTIIRDVLFSGRTEGRRRATLLVKRLYFSGPWPVSAGTPLKAWLGDGAHGSACARMKVEECSPRDEGWTVCYTLLEVPPSDLVTLFGYSDRDEVEVCKP